MFASFYARPCRFAQAQTRTARWHKDSPKTELESSVYIKTRRGRTDVTVWRRLPPDSVYDLR